MLRKQKEEVVAGMAEGFGAAELMVVARHSGMTVAEMTDLRRRMRAAGAGFRVTKNRLARLALEGTPFACIGPLFAGPTAVAFSADPVSAAKVVVDYANENAKIAVLGGALGAKALDTRDVEALARLPSLDELRGGLVGLLTTPAARIAQVLAAPGAQIARVLSAHASSADGG